MNWQTYWKRCFEKRHLVWLLARREISVKYAQSVLGVAWIILQPITGMLIFTLFFTKIFQFNQQLSIPYYLFSYSGFLLWILFSNVLNGGGLSLLNEEMLIRKVYFPRLLIIIYKSTIYMIDFIIGFLLLMLMLLFDQPDIIWRVLLTLPVVIWIFLMAFTLALWFSALTIRYRDLSHVIPFLVNFGIWLSPVFFPISILPDSLKNIIQLNPVVIPLEAFRHLIWDTPMPEITLYFWLAQTVMIGLFFTGIHYFIRMDQWMSEYL